MAAAALILSAWPLPSCAEDLPMYTLTTAQYQVGFDFRPALGPEQLDTLTIEHANAWAWGDNFAFVDVLGLALQDGGAPVLYGEWDPRLSYRRITHDDFGASIVRDVLFAAQVNFGSGGYLVHLEGAAVDFEVPGFVTVQLHAYVRDDVHLPGATFQITGVWILPFDLFGVAFRTEGYFDLAGPEGNTALNLLSQPRVYLDVGALFDAPGHAYAGMELLIWINALGVRDQHELVPQPALRVSF
jgi:nucleoside-specific outer membrane channel protein Tsx